MESQPVKPAPEPWLVAEVDEMLRTYPDSSLAALAAEMERKLSVYDQGEEAGRAVIAELRSRIAAGVRFWPFTEEEEDKEEPLYILDAEKKPVSATKEQWGAFRVSPEAYVAKTTLRDDAEVTTYFAGVDNSYGDDPQPYLFQTVVGIGNDTSVCDYYRAWGEAEAGHESTVSHYRSLLNGAQNSPE